jgi:hypothetical protein
VRLQPGLAVVEASLAVPGMPFGGWLNLRAVLRETDALPRVQQLRIGRLPVPGWLAQAALPRVLQALAPLPVSVIAATAGHADGGPWPDNARVASYLPGTLAARRASLVICNGGSPSTQQALAAGVPVLGIAGNLDQYLNMQGVLAVGAGRCLR